MSDGGNVLVVEGDDELRAAYDRVLAEFYSVSTAACGERAFETMTDDTDAVVLDRPLPKMSVAALVGELTARYDRCCVGMVTSSEPHFDVTRWLGIDDYLVKPVTTEQLRATVDRLIALAEYGAIYWRLSQKRVRKSVLVQEKSAAELERSGEFQRLEDEIDRLEAELDDIVDEVSETARGLKHHDS
ncbi:response regulator [Haloarcula laminariae]|uniref:response regulator n=1 Tax=Haloarcula laminariae TaxID=2961577 RepID=UPI0021C62F9B|nr:HalX domain-containing protein [Halomicroarcula laminariae]